MTEFFTPDGLGTFAGQVALVVGFTQLFKRYAPSVDPKWIALGLSLAVGSIVQIVFMKDLSPEGLVMALFNTFVVLSASIGAYESLVKPVARGIQKEIESDEVK